MRRISTTLLSLSVVLLFAAARPAAAQFYLQHNLVSDGAIPADITDGSLVNPWGLAASASSPWWVANNQTGTSTLYNGNTGAKQALEVTVPGAPTGLVFHGGTTGFVVTNGSASGPAAFIFASEDGSISGWNPAVPPPPPSHVANIAVQPDPANVYKGLAIASTMGGDFLYATNFRAGTIDVYDDTWALHPMPGGFTDPDIPAGYAPFGIQNIGGVLYVTYALQDEDKMDDVPGMGHGFVDAYTTGGTLIRRVASRGTLNSPWGLALAPEKFGKFEKDLLVGNFGDGRIHAYDLEGSRRHGEAKFRGILHGADGPPLTIEGLWSLQFGNGAAAGSKKTLFFTAGPFDEMHGLFGTIVPAEPPGEDEGGDN